MIKFLFKGLMRDKSRSLIPIIVVAMGVIMTVFLQSLLSGVIGDSIESTANFTTGHVKVMTRPYNENMSQLPKASRAERPGRAVPAVPCPSRAGHRRQRWTR